MAVCACLAVVTYLPFCQVVNFDFVNLDTPAYVYNNPHVQSGLNWESVKWAFTSTEISNWHPITWLSHLLDVELFGMQSGAHHHTSVILHIVNTLLLFVFLEAVTGCLWRCALVALLFALHPLHVESVAWVAERKDILCGLFFFLALLSYREYITSVSRSGWYLATLACFILGLMAKPMLVTLPFLLLVLDFWPFNRYGSDRLNGNQSATGTSRGGYGLLIEKIPMLLVSLGMSVLILNLQEDSGAVASVATLHYGERLSNALIAYVLYLRDILWPLYLCVYYPLTGGIDKGYSLAALLLLGAIFALVFKFRKKYKWALSGWLWYTGMLIPVIGIVQVGAQSRADRYTYLPAVGIFILLAWMAAELAERSKPAKLLVGAVTLAGLLGMVPLTVRQIGFWENNEKLYRRALSVTTDNGVIHYNLGVALYNKNNFKDALTHFHARLETFPTDARAHNLIGLIRMRTGDLTGAILHFNQAVQFNDAFIDARINLASAYKHKGDLEMAILTYQAALQKSPDNPRLHNNLATALIHRCELQAAKRHFKIALRNDPGNEKALNNLNLVACLENEVAEKLFAHGVNAPGSLSQGSNAEMIAGVKGVFAKYRIIASVDDLQKMVSRGEPIPGSKEKSACTSIKK